MRNGFLKSVFSFLSFIIGFYLAVKFHSGFSLLVHKIIKDEKISDLLSFLFILIVIYSAGIFVASKISKFNVITKTFDKVAGLIFGIFKGFIVVSLILIFSKSFSLISESNIGKSTLYPYVCNAAPKTFNAVSSFIPVSKKTFDELNPFIEKDTTIKK
jgi:uncharacterized membrane protein required for colicin V production